MYLNIKRSSVLPSTSAAFFYLIEGLPTMPALNPLLICRTIITLSPGNKEDFEFGMESGDQSAQRMDGLLFYFFTGSCLSICSCCFFCSAVPAVDQWTKTALLCKSPEQEIDSRPFQRRQLLTLENGAIFCLID